MRVVRDRPVALWVAKHYAYVAYLFAGMMETQVKMLVLKLLIPNSTASVLYPVFIAFCS